MGAIISLLTVVLPPVLKIIEVIIEKAMKDDDGKRVKEAYAQFLKEHKEHKAAKKCQRAKK